MATLVEIVPYDASWPRHFLKIAKELRAILGPNAIAIEHIGSTAVPGLPAKPVIDVDVILSGPSDISSASDALVAAGYEARENRYDDGVRAFLKRSATPQQRFYLCPPGNRTHERRLVFRDVLRGHAETAAAYATLKTELARKFPYDGDAYTAAKGDFISRVVGKALPDTAGLTAS